MEHLIVLWMSINFICGLLRFSEFQIIQAHPEMEFYVGFDVDPTAHEIAQDKINAVLAKDSDHPRANLQVHTILKNFKSIKSVLQDIDGDRSLGVQGILMDLGMSSMQV